MAEAPVIAASEIARRVASRELSPVAVVEAALERVARRNPELNAIVTLNPRALEDARALERKLRTGAAPGLLAGVPVGIKDVTQVGGLRTTFGSPLYRDHVPSEDAVVVQRLRAADAIILGKTNRGEFAAGGNTGKEGSGRTGNPGNPSRSAGGAPGGGAAALATGMIALAEGTDLGGSLRVPASFCGVVGLRPSPGLVPTSPSDYVWDTLQVTGPMARSAADVALMLQAIAGPSPFTPLRQPMAGRDFGAAVRQGPRRGLRLAYSPDIAGIGIDPAIESACRSAAWSLEGTGARIELVELDLSEGRAAFLALRGLWFATWMQERLDRIDDFGVNVRNNMRAGLGASVAELGVAEAARGRLWHRLRQLFAQFDHLLTPTMAVAPFPVEQNYPDHVAGKPMQTYIDWLAPTFVLSLAGLPVVSVPCGLVEGLPVGLQVVGGPEGEESVLALAAALQTSCPVGAPPDPA